MTGVAAAITTVLALGVAGAPASQPEPTAPHYLLARDGSQCTLQEQASAVAAAEQARLQRLGIEVSGAWVAFLLRDDALPAACLPADPEAFFTRYPGAAAGVVRSAGPTCEACGCPETWYLCVASTSPPAALRTAGYAPVPMPEGASP